MRNNAKTQYDIQKAWVASWNVHTKRKFRKTKIHESWAFLYNFSQLETHKLCYWKTLHLILAQVENNIIENNKTYVLSLLTHS